MPTQDDIDSLQARLTSYRYTLGHYLRQRAMLSGPFEPPGIAAGIAEVRQGIVRLKNALHAWHVPVEDHPDDQSSGWQSSSGGDRLPAGRQSASTPVSTWSAPSSHSGRCVGRILHRMMSRSKRVPCPRLGHLLLPKNLRPQYCRSNAVTLSEARVFAPPRLCVKMRIIVLTQRREDAKTRRNTQTLCGLAPLRLCVKTRSRLTRRREE
jgi:hypothetical protein